MTKTGWAKKTKASMMALGTYKEEYKPLIDIYAFMLETMDDYMKDPPEDERRIEILRKDIITYSDRLRLNPKSSEVVEVKIETKDRLEQALDKMIQNE